MQHVDEFIDDYGSDPYASYFFMLKRLPAVLQSKFYDIIMELTLFCDYRGKRYRVTGASRMGDVWLTSDFKRHQGYDLRVDVAECSNFSKNA